MLNRVDNEGRPERRLQKSRKKKARTGSGSRDEK